MNAVYSSQLCHRCGTKGQ
ncbi:MAG: hypothetical protein ACE5R6_13180 [Candidatus Heimdallarchaeota archaeon]